MRVCSFKMSPLRRKQKLLELIVARGSLFYGLQYHLPETVFTILTAEFPEQESEGGQTKKI